MVIEFISPGSNFNNQYKYERIIGYTEIVENNKNTNFLK